MECWKREDYVNKMEDHLLNTSAGNSIFGLINKGERINDKNKGEDDGNEYKQELFPMIKELYTNCQRTSLENATEFLKMQNDVSKNISLADATKHFDFAVASMNKVWFRADQLKIYSWQECYDDLLNQWNSILCKFDSNKEVCKKAMDSRPELILALYILYYFGTKNYDSKLRNIKNYEEEIFKFKGWQDFLDSISSEKYDRKNPYLRKMAEDFFNRRQRKDPAIQIVIDNYKKRGVFSSKQINQEKAMKEDELKDFKNKININIKGENNEFKEKDESYEYEKFVKEKNKNEINTNTERDEANNNDIKIDNNIKDKNNDGFQGESNSSKSYEDEESEKNHVNEKTVEEKNKNEINTNTERNEANNNKTTIMTNYKQVIINNHERTNDVKRQNSEDNKKPNTKYNKKKIALIILTVLIFLLLIVAIVSGNPIFIKTMIAIAVIYVTLIIILICYKDCVSKSEAQERIRFNNDMKGYGREIDKSLNLNYESDEKINITQQYTNDQENRFPSE